MKLENREKGMLWSAIPLILGTPILLGGVYAYILSFRTPGVMDRPYDPSFFEGFAIIIGWVALIALGTVIGSAIWTLIWSHFFSREDLKSYMRGVRPGGDDEKHRHELQGIVKLFDAISDVLLDWSYRSKK